MLRPVPTAPPTLLSCQSSELVRYNLVQLLSFQEPQAQDSVSRRGRELWYPEVSGHGQVGGRTAGWDVAYWQIECFSGKAGWAWCDKGWGPGPWGFFPLVLGPRQDGMAVVWVWLQVDLDVVLAEETPETPEAPASAFTLHREP